MTRTPNTARHDFIEEHFDHLQREGIIVEWRYERAAQRYLVTLDHDRSVSGTAEDTDTLVMSLMTSEAFIAGAEAALEVAARRPRAGFAVDPEGEAVLVEP